MSALTKKHFLPRTSVTETARIPLRLIAIVAVLLLTMMPLLTGCGGGETGSEPLGVTASLAWQPVQDSSVYAYFVHYGRQSPGKSGSCAYESSMYVDSPSATVTNLDPDTRYYFTVSAYNDLESACSNEVSTVTPPLSVQTDEPSPSPAPEMPITNRRGVSDAPGQPPHGSFQRRNGI